MAKSENTEQIKMDLELNQDAASARCEQDNPSPAQAPVSQSSLPVPADSPRRPGVMSCRTGSVKFSPKNKTVKRVMEESPTKLRTLSPKSLFTEKVEYIPLPKIPKKKVHQSHTVRPILPKPYMFGPKVPSPTKTAALMLKKKATLVCQRKSPVKILPKRPHLETKPVLQTCSRILTRSQGNKEKVDRFHTQQDSSEKNIQVQLASEARVEINAVTDQAPDCENGVLSNEDGIEVMEKDEDQMQLEDLMAACTTIRYDPKKNATNQDGDTKSKSQKKRDSCLSMLEEDILETDPKKDERDTEYAKDYFNRVKRVLQDAPDRFRQFLILLHEMNKDNSDPVKLYAEVAAVLHDHQDLVDDFACFLLSHQAMECGCFVSCFQYQQLREFLRKLEIYCDNATTTFQRTLKMLSKWLTSSSEAHREAIPFKERMSTILKNVPAILDELLDYFLDGQLQGSPSDEFEEVDLEATSTVSGFEELTLPAARETYNTRLCGCSCHQNKEDERLQRRTKHCFSCSLKLDNGMPVLKMSKLEYRPITVIYPHEEREKLKKAKREAAQLALAKAKAQRSGSKKDKTRGSSQNGKAKRLTVKRKQRKKISKPRKSKNTAERNASQIKADLSVEGAKVCDETEMGNSEKACASSDSLTCMTFCTSQQAKVNCVSSTSDLKSSEKHSHEQDDKQAKQRQIAQDNPKVLMSHSFSNTVIPVTSASSSSSSSSTSSSSSSSSSSS